MNSSPESSPNGDDPLTGVRHDIETRSEFYGGTREHRRRRLRSHGVDCCVLRADASGTLPHANAKAYNQSAGGTIHIQAVSMGKHRSKRSGDGLPRLGVAAGVCTHTPAVGPSPTLVLYAARNTPCVASPRWRRRRAVKGVEQR